MTPTSLLPKIAASAGIDYGMLCEQILLGAGLHAGLPQKKQPRISQISDSATETDEEVLTPKRAVG
jgi:D-alanine-D-alanine ligase